MLDPLKVVIENYPEGQTEELEAPYYPTTCPKKARASLPFGREIYIERDDFREDPPKGFFRLAPGREVRLRYAYLITCTDVIRDDDGKVTELRCTYDPATRGGDAPDGRKVKGTLHWVSAEHSLPVEVRLYDRLFLPRGPGRPGGGLQDLPEPGLPRDPDRAPASSQASVAPGVGDSFQFERQGYFAVDPPTLRLVLRDWRVRWSSTAR